MGGPESGRKSDVLLANGGVPNFQCMYPRSLVNSREDFSYDTNGWLRSGNFGTRVCRRFVHGFTICGDIFRCYLHVFDRAAVSMSTGFGIGRSEKALRLFTRIMLDAT